MIGPKKLGFWSSLKAINIRTQRGMLTPNQKYRVIKEFIDADGTTHKIGDTWVFLACSYVPYDNGLQWFITLDNTQEWLVPLWLEEEAHRRVDAHLEEYLEICI